jgi:hypothetical protein
MQCARRRDLRRIIVGRIRSLALILTAVVVGLSAPAPAMAQADVGTPTAGDSSRAAPDAGDGTVQWSVTPVDRGDGRRTFNVELRPGASAEDAIVVRNLSSHDVTFKVSANDGYRTKSGSFDMRASDHAPEFGGAWISHPASVAIPAGSQAEVPFTIKVPDNATPGDYIAGIAASITANASENVVTEHRVGVGINLRVSGAAVPGASLMGAVAVYHPSWNPFSPGSVTMQAQVVNSGNVRFSGTLGGGAAGADAIATDGQAAPVELLPSETRTLTSHVDRVWPLGPVTVTYVVAPQVVPIPGSTDNLPAMAAIVTTVTVWAIPWAQIVLLALIAVLVFGWLRVRRARRERLQALLAQARAEGARVAVGGRPTDHETNEQPNQD